MPLAGAYSPTWLHNQVPSFTEFIPGINILPQFSIAHLRNNPFLASTSVVIDTSLTTSNPTYSLPLVAKVVIKSLDRSTLYIHDPFNPPAVNPVIFCNLNLSLSHHGSFELQIEDSDLTLDTGETLDRTGINNAARVLIYLGKTPDKMYLRFSGMVRQSGYTRGCENNLLYNLSGFGTAIRFNERILDVHLEPPVLDSDGVTLDTSNPEFFADEIIDDSVDQKNYYPQGTLKAKVEGDGGYGHLDTSSTVGNSPIQDFIPGVHLRFGEIEDLHSQIENYTGARVYVNQIDKVQFQPLRTPFSENNGFVITTDYQPTRDLADNTMYARSEDYTWADSIDKAAGYSNSLFGILPASVVPDVKTNSGLTDNYENKTVEIAQRFRPITNPNWRLFCTVEAIGMDNTADEDAVRARWRICKDDNGVPMNTGGIVANKYMPPNKHYNTSDGGLQTIEIMGEGNADLNENDYYWLILTSVNATGSIYWRWYKDNDLRSFTATASPGTSSDTNGGTGWTTKESERMSMLQTRFKAEPYNILDTKAIFNRILIESVVPSFPQQITTKQGATKYLLGLMQGTARPRRVYDFNSVTCPNKPPQAGDVCVIRDPRFNFSMPGHRVEAGQITDVNYSFGAKGGGSTPSSKGLEELSLSVIGYPNLY